jgi:hypothetical protein
MDMGGGEPQTMTCTWHLNGQLSYKLGYLMPTNHDMGSSALNNSMGSGKRFISVIIMMTSISMEDQRGRHLAFLERSVYCELKCMEELSRVGAPHSYGL